MDKIFNKFATKKITILGRGKIKYAIKLKPISSIFLKHTSKSYALSVQLIFLVIVFLFSCDRILDSDDDYSLVFEIKRHTTFFDRDSTDMRAHIFWTGVKEYDIDNKTLYLYNHPSTSYYLIFVVERFTDGDGVSGGSKVAFFHNSFPTKTPLYSFPIITEPESLLISNLDNEKIAFKFRGQSITLEPFSNWIWIDSMYVQTEVGKTFAVDSFKFINHGLLNIELK